MIWHLLAISLRPWLVSSGVPLGTGLGVMFLHSGLRGGEVVLDSDSELGGGATVLHVGTCQEWWFSWGWGWKWLSST